MISRISEKLLYIDLETYSTIDLRKSNPYRYAEDPEFLILMAAWATGDDPDTVHVAIGADAILKIPGLFDPRVIKVAHNAPFERICLSAFASFQVGSYLPIRSFHDTQAVAGCYGWPQSLDKLARALGGPKKDSAGTALINWFCKPDRHGNRRLPEDHPEKWEQFVEYCRQDVVALIAIDQALGDFPTEMERDIYFAHEEVNDTGMLIDTLLATKAVDAAELNRMVQELELGNITGLAKPGNPATLRAWFKEQGVRMPDMTAETVTAKLVKLDALRETDSERRRALELRQELALTAAAKFTAALDSVSSDGRLRGAFRYFGAHTGRWSGRGAQPQNLPRSAFEKPHPDKPGKMIYDELAQDTAILDLLMDFGASPEELKKLVRPMFIFPSPCGSVVDFSSIEARVIAWLAGEQWALEAFAEGRDIYVETAERMGGLTRAQGKIAVLAFGFAGSVGSLRKMAGPGDDFVNDMSDDQVRDELVFPWRRANPAIVRLWRDLEDAFGSTGKAGRVHVTHHEDSLGRNVRIHLPSGRAINYHGVRYESYGVQDPLTLRWSEKTSWRYSNPKDPFNKKMRIGTYGGRLTENITQAVARDIQGEALVRLRRAGYRPVGHVHDEILTDSPDLASVEALMTVPPRWAKGLPIDGDGFTCVRYKKG